jgi:mannitol-1-phosphate/altronate dehydrogenase
MILTAEEKIIFSRFRNIYLRHGKSPAYIAYLRKRFPGKEIHHVYGSVHGMKSSDFGTVPVDPVEHREKQNDPRWCYDQMYLAVELLIEYVEWKAESK